MQLEGNLIKAGVVYNLLKYTHWTGGKTQGDLALCYIGGDALGDALEVLEGRTAQRMTIRIRDLADGDSLLGCHVSSPLKELGFQAAITLARYSSTTTRSASPRCSARARNRLRLATRNPAAD